MQEWARVMMKGIVGAIATGMLLFPLYVEALGFGNIKVKSALNEPLDAEIELLSATDDEVKELEVKLASREAFMRAGVDRSAQLSQIKFTIVKRGSKYFIQLRTPQSVREPFLNFLLEMNWKNGRMLREYTVLLDPPDRAPQQIASAPPEPTPAKTAPPVEAPAPPPVVTTTAPTQPAESPFLSPEPAPSTTVAETTPAVPVEPPVPAKDTAAAEKTDKKGKKGKKSAKQAKSKEPSPKADTPPPSAEVAKADGSVTPSADPATSPSLTLSQEDELFPHAPLTANNNIDAKALEAQIKQSRKAQASEPVAKPVQAPEPAPAPLTPEAPIASTEPAPVPLTPEAPIASTEPTPGLPGDSPSQPVSPDLGSSTAMGTLDYGITRKGDNLWSIANKIKPDNNVTVYQIMLALQQSNPDAFVKGNIHRLKPGQVMRIEDPRVLTAISKEQAAKHYSEQTREWQDYLTSVGAQIPRQAIVAGDTGVGAAESAAVTSGELTLTPPQGDAEGAGSGGSTALAKRQETEKLRQEVKKAVQETVAERRKNVELSSKVEELEKELKRLENLVTVKNSDLASLQQKLQAVQEKRDSTTKQDSAKATPPPVTPPTEAVKPTIQPQPEPQSTPTQTAGESVATEPTAPVSPATDPSTTAQPPADTTPVTPPTETTTVAPVQPVKTGVDTGLVAKLSALFGGMGLYVVIGGVVLLLLAVLLFIWIRRRNSIHFQESILKSSNGASNSQFATSVILPDATPSKQSTPSSVMTGGGESSFLSDFAISGVSAIQAEDSEVDPLTEADVFMAYGRYEAAEERLQEAIKQDPKRGELRVKLLELFATTKNKKAFESTAEDFYASLGGTAGGNPLWQKVAAMGAEIAPNNPLFKEGAGAGGGMGFVSTSNLNDSKVMDIGLDTGAFSKSDFAFEPPAGKTAGSRQNDDTNLDYRSTLGAKSLDTEPSQSGSNDAIDFSLDFPASSGTTSHTKEPEKDLGLDFQLDMGKDDEPTATDIKFDSDTSTSLDFDLEGATAAKGNGNGKDSPSTVEMNLDAAADSISLDMTGSGDEVGTKLDLARAYIDMGDPDGARSILDEVIAEGNDGQKQEARQLMQQIG